MQLVEDQPWFLRKHEDGTVFGPVGFQQLARWASAAQIAPQDVISTDGAIWIKAPMLPELGMDWLVEVTSERYYGPTTTGAVFEFLKLGEITPDTFVINTCNGSRRAAGELDRPYEPNDDEANDRSGSPTASGMAINFSDRVRELEQTLREERRALRESEQRYRELELRYRELIDQLAADGTLR